MTAAIDITVGQRKTLLALLRRYIPGVAVWAYGSRVKWTARPNSDLDLVAFTTPEQQPLVSELKDALAESDLPFLVDFHVWGDVPERFHEIIRKEYVVLQEAKQSESDAGMASEWKRISLREAGVTLIDCDHRTPPAADSGFPYVAIPQLKEGRLDLSGVRRISPEHFVDWTRKAKPQHFDVILSRRCNPGETAYVPANIECALGQNLVLLRSDAKKVFPPFLRWLVRGPDWWEQVGTFINVGAVFDSLKCADIPNFKMHLPPLPEQKAIAHILGTLDDKIELNRRMNATLEAMARALFQSWFVDFDPVRAKLDGRQPGGLDAATAALFPAHFQESPLGHIPQGWEIRSLDQVADYLNGLALQKYPPGDRETLPVIKIAQLRKGNSEGADRCNTELAPQYIVEDGEVLFSWSGSLEVELWCGGRGALNQHLFKVTSSVFPKWFYYLWTLYHLDEFRLIAADKATTMGHIQRGHLTAAKVLVPPPALLESMTHIMAPLIDQIISNRTQSRTLVTIRDALLPKLLSGDTHVTNFEDEVARV